MRAPRVGPWGAPPEGARWRCRAGGTWGGGRAGFVRGHGLGSSLWWRPRAGGVRPHSLWWARQASGMCDGEGTAMCPVAYVCDTRATRRHRRGVSAYTARAPETGVHDIRGTTRRRFAAKE